jgi:MFS family permease
MATVPPDGDLREAPMGELVKQLADQTSTLVKKELELAKAEMSQKGREAGKAGGLLGGAGAVALLAAGTLTAFIVLLLDEVMDSWLAALIVTIVYAAIAGVLALQGRNRVQRATPPVPEQTVETVKEDVEWAKTRRRSAGT